MKINKETLQKIILEEIKTELDRDIDADSLGMDSDGAELGNRDGSEAIPAIVAKRKFGLLYRYADHKMKDELKHKGDTGPEERTRDDAMFKLFKATREYAKKALTLQNEIEKIRNSILNLVPAFKKEENKK